MKLPWQSGEDDGTGTAPDDGPPPDADADADAAPVPDGEPLVECAFQDGTLRVYAEGIHVERPWRSRFDDVWIPAEEVDGVDYDEGLLVGSLQVVRVGVAPDAGGLLSDPVNERTVHFGRGQRECASEARDEIEARAGGI
jgi:hypothetical protein